MKNFLLMGMALSMLVLWGCGQKIIAPMADPLPDESMLTGTVNEKNRDADDPDTTDEIADDEKEATVYVIDVAESSVNREAGRVVLGGDHVGTVDIKSGKSTYINNQLVSAEAVLDMTTIKSDNERLDDHLKSEDFFAVEQYPEAKIRITSTENINDKEQGDYTLATADLTIKDITHEVSFPIYHDEYRDVANITIDRTLRNIRYGSTKFFDDLKDTAIRDDIVFEVNISYILE